MAKLTRGGTTFDIPEQLGEIINQTQTTDDLFQWEPRPGMLGVGDSTITEAAHCPRCKAEASTFAIQLTYQVGEPDTLHMWCLKGHAWRWNQIEGRVAEPDRWQQ